MKTPTFIVVIVTLLLTLLWLTFIERDAHPTPVACTLEARICPDGSSVGREGPNCEFATCPSQERPEVATDEEVVACTMDAMICPDGTAVGRVAPSCAFAPCPNTPQVSEDVVIKTPLEEGTILSPVTIEGTARGTWFFEGSFPIVVVDWDGRIIGEGIASAQGDWMTSDMVPFIASVSYTVPKDTSYSHGTIIFKKDNPSGLPENDAAHELPVVFGELPKDAVYSQ